MELPTQDRQIATSRSAYVIALYGALGLLALMIAAGRGDVDVYGLTTAGTAELLIGPVVGLALGLVVVLLSRLVVRYYPWARTLHRGFQALLGELSRREILILAVASSVGEELLFRGALMPWIGLWPQAFLFAALHVGPGRKFAPWTVSALVLGALFGYLTIWTGNLGAPIAAHFTINALNLRFIVSTKLPPEEPTPE